MSDKTVSVKACDSTSTIGQAGPIHGGTRALRVAITGAGGFLGWHVRVLAEALGWPEPVVISRADIAAADVVAARLEGIDRVLHLAGLNLGDPAEVVAGNVKLAEALVQGLRRCTHRPASVVFANSVLAGNGTPYGDAKAMAAETLTTARSDLVDVRLPNLYGEHGRPFRNGVTATFCGLLASGQVPEVHEDRELRLVHVTDAAARLLGAPASGTWDAAMPAVAITIPELAQRLTDCADVYRRGNLPSLSDRPAIRIFNTYRSHLVPSQHPLPPSSHGSAENLLTAMSVGADGAGELVRSIIPRNERQVGRFHLATVRRVLVLRGTADIVLRRVGHQAVVRLQVAAEDETVVDVPTMWAYEITNRGSTELMMHTWTNARRDDADLDTFSHAGTSAPDLAPVVA
ncbi:NAD-dependent epimerase/dehydratase family protein [Micromonospora sp. NPDC049891]|uniref:polysaccharide biosynthesis C-terminal domain-containing protein n=1 Tax=Micromonospora sp. NPDC049891 TaxID=3155655 RepID=UPI0033C73255